MKNTNDIFIAFDEIKANYREGLIDKTDMLSSIAKIIGNEVLENSAENRKKANENADITKKFEKVMKIFSS